MSSQDSVSIKLSDDEALVLFDLLARELDDRDGVHLRPAAEHDGELWALNALHSSLERTLVEPLSAAYAARVKSARKSLLSRCGAWPA